MWGPFPNRLRDASLHSRLDEDLVQLYTPRRVALRGAICRRRGAGKGKAPTSNVTLEISGQFAPRTTSSSNPQRLSLATPGTLIKWLDMVSLGKVDRSKSKTR